MVGKLLYIHVDKLGSTNSLLNEWVIPEKIHTPTTEGMLENLTGGGLTALEIQTGGGYILRVTFDFIDVLIASIDTF